MCFFNPNFFSFSTVAESLSTLSTNIRFQHIMRLAECIRRNQNKFSWEPKHSSRQCLLAELNIRQSQHFKVCCWAEVYHSRHFKMLCWAEISAVSAFYSVSASLNPYLQAWKLSKWQITLSISSRWVLSGVQVRCILHCHQFLCVLRWGVVYLNTLIAC